MLLESRQLGSAGLFLRFGFSAALLAVHGSEKACAWVFLRKEVKTNRCLGKVDSRVIALSREWVIGLNIDSGLVLHVVLSDGQ